MQAPVKATILVSMALLGCFAVATNLHPNADKLKTLENPRLTITRYIGRPNFSSQSTLIWNLQDGKFFAGNRVNTRILKNFSKCESVLAQQERFPLEKMVSTDYLQPNQIDEFIAGSLQLRPGQVNFLQATRNMPVSEAEALFGDNYRNRINDALVDHDNYDLKPIVTATMRTVAAQVLNPLTGKLEIVEMPWQRDEIRRDIGKDFDRKKYKFVWEWGRTTQDLPKEAAPLMAASAAINYQELLAMGGRLEDGWVMFHSLGPLNTRFFGKLFPNTLYPADWENKNDAIFLIPLADAIKKFSPREYSGRLSKLYELSGHGLDDTKAMSFWQRFQRIQFTQLDFDGLSKPLGLHDVSMGAAFRRATLSAEYQAGGSDEFTSFLMRQQGPRPSWNTGQYVDISDMDVTTQYLAQQNAVEISNLDVNDVNRDPKAIEKVLVGVLTYYLKALVPGDYNDDLVHKALNWLNQQKVRFAITTFQPQIAARTRALQPIAEHKYYYPPTDFKADFPGQEWLGWGYNSPPHAFLFSIEQIVALINNQPDIYAQVLNSCRENIWARHLMLSDPDIF